MKNIDSIKNFEKFEDQILDFAFTQRDRIDRRINQLTAKFQFTDEDYTYDDHLTAEQELVKKVYTCLIAASASLEELIENIK